MSIETVSVEQTLENTMKLKWKGDMGWGMGLRWDEWGEVWSRRSPSGCDDAIWPTGGRVQPPRIEAASLAGEKAAFTRAGMAPRARSDYKARMHETHLSPQHCLGWGAGEQVTITGNHHHESSHRAPLTVAVISGKRHLELICCVRHWQGCQNKEKYYYSEIK